MLLKNYWNLLLATLVFAYFTEVFLDVFITLKEKIVKRVETQIDAEKYKKFEFIKIFVSIFRKLKINIFFVYLFYFVSFLSFVLFIFIPILGQVGNVVKVGMERLPYILNNFKSILENFLKSYNIHISMEDIFSNLGNLMNVVLSTLTKLITAFISSLGDWLVLILLPLLGLYFIGAKREFIQWLENNFQESVVFFFKRFDHYQKLYIKAIIINIISIIVLSSLIFSFLIGLDGISYGIIYGLFSFIPIIGPILGSLPIIIISFSKSLALGVIMIVVVFLIQQLSDNLIMPKTVERFMVVNPFLSIISILGFYTIFNFWSIFIAVPLTLTIRDLIESQEGGDRN